MGIAINGARRPHPPTMLHDCEAMQAEYGSGKITISTGKGSLTLAPATPEVGLGGSPRQRPGGGPSLLPGIRLRE